MSITSILSPLFEPRQRQLERYATDAESLQTGVMRRLLSGAASTEWGVAHGFAGIRSYEDFAASSPLNSYDDLKPFIVRMMHGEKDVLWRGRVSHFAKSSGTTSDRSKFLPVSSDALRDTHYRGGQDCVAAYLKNNPSSRIFDGRALILGGSRSEADSTPESMVGDLSAILIQNINPLVNLIRVPAKQTALLPDFEVKRDRIAREAMKKNVTNLSGVPSWMLSVMNRVLELSGAANLLEVWPHLEMFFHGGVAFTPYRELYRKLIPSEGMHYMETYNASEGFFGVQTDPADVAMSLMVDYGIFYEFVPMEELEKESPEVLPLWAVEPNKNYAVVISTSSGLWRYLIGDTVRFTSCNPYKFVITGRTKSFINAFGEEVIVDNAEKALHEACRQTGAQVLEYTAAPIYMDASGRCRHQWLVEFAREPEDLQQFARLLDEALRGINSDYDAKRHKDITLQPLEVVKARKGLFHDWLESKGKLGGQHKVPRLSNSRQHIEELLKMNV